MGKDTKIEWCDHSLNFWIGCDEISPACDFCYAREEAKRRGWAKWGVDEPRYRTAPSTWKQPFAWDRAAARDGVIRTVFSLSLGDIWDNKIDPSWRREAFDVMRACPNLLFLLLSKRIGNATRMALPSNAAPTLGHDHPPPLPPNAALGATMVDQEEWDRDLPKLLIAGKVLGARFTFASVEPMLGPIEMMRKVADFPNWVICGGESGPNARPMHPEWARRLRDQCAAIGVPFLWKQWGEWRPTLSTEPYDTSSLRSPKVRLVSIEDGTVHCFRETAGINPEVMIRVGKKAAGRLLDGVEHNQRPF